MVAAYHYSTGNDVDKQSQYVQVTVFSYSRVLSCQLVPAMYAQYSTSLYQVRASGYYAIVYCMAFTIGLPVQF